MVKQLGLSKTQLARQKIKLLVVENFDESVRIQSRPIAGDDERKPQVVNYKLWSRNIHSKFKILQRIKL
jgi:hypothetical protein